MRVGKDEGLSMRYSFRKDLYSKESFIKAAYNFVDDFYLHLDSDDEYYIVDMEPRRTGTDGPQMQEFQNEMLIQETRRIVNDRTMHLREMMYARAMASTVIEEPAEEKVFAEESAEKILTDWFEENE